LKKVSILRKKSYSPMLATGFASTSSLSISLLPLIPPQFLPAILSQCY
jgi:hypothetical protein